MNKYLLAFIAALVMALCISISKCSDIRQDRNRLSRNQRSLLENISFYKTKDSLNAASIEQLTLTVKEFKEYFPELTETVRSLDIKVKRLQSVAQMVTEASYTITTPIVDSIIVRDTVEKPITLKCIDYNNKYLQVVGCDENGVFKGSIHSVDTLVQVVHRVPRKFWFIKWGTKAIRQEVVSKNPYSKIVFTEYLNFR